MSSLQSLWLSLGLFCRWLVQILIFYNPIINSSQSPPFSRIASFLIHKKDRDGGNPQVSMLVLNVYAVEGGFWLPYVFSFHTTKCVCCMCVMCGRSVLCVSMCLECVPLKALKIISAFKLSPGRGPESCRPYQWPLHIHPLCVPREVAWPVGGVQLFIIFQIKMSLGAPPKPLTLSKCPFLIVCP